MLCIESQSILYIMVELNARNNTVQVFTPSYFKIFRLANLKCVILTSTNSFYF